MCAFTVKGEMARFHCSGKCAHCPKYGRWLAIFQPFEDGMARQPVTGIQMRCHSQLDVNSIVTWAGVMCPCTLKPDMLGVKARCWLYQTRRRSRQFGGGGSMLYLDRSETLQRDDRQV